MVITIYCFKITAQGLIWITTPPGTVLKYHCFTRARVNCITAQEPFKEKVMVLLLPVLGQLYLNLKMHLLLTVTRITLTGKAAPLLPKEENIKQSSSILMAASGAA